jgi:hypothetical protein
LQKEHSCKLPKDVSLQKVVKITDVCMADSNLNACKLAYIAASQSFPLISYFLFLFFVLF